MRPASSAAAASSAANGSAAASSSAPMASSSSSSLMSSSASPVGLLPVAAACSYAPCFCEENVWKLCEHLKKNAGPHQLSRVSGEDAQYTVSRPLVHVGLVTVFLQVPLCWWAELQLLCSPGK